MKDKCKFIIFTAIIASLFMIIVDSIIKPPYFIKSSFKVLLFSFVMIYYSVIYDKQFNWLKNILKLNKKQLKYSLIIGVTLYFGILFSYNIFKNFINLNDISKNLNNNTGVNYHNFIYVSLYISFFNSFIEELFFRGYSSILLKENTTKKFAYIFSSIIFSIYHIGMTSGWFNPFIWIISFLGLFIGGIIFNYLNEKNNNIYTSWIVHIFVNLGINTIGMVMFGIM